MMGVSMCRCYICMEDIPKYHNSFGVYRSSPPLVPPGDIDLGTRHAHCPRYRH